MCAVCFISFIYPLTRREWCGRNRNDEISCKFPTSLRCTWSILAHASNTCPTTWEVIWIPVDDLIPSGLSAHSHGTFGISPHLSSPIPRDHGSPSENGNCWGDDWTPQSSLDKVSQDPYLGHVCLCRHQVTVVPSRQLSQLFQTGCFVGAVWR